MHNFRDVNYKFCHSRNKYNSTSIFKGENVDFRPKNSRSRQCKEIKADFLEKPILRGKNCKKIYLKNMVTSFPKLIKWRESRMIGKIIKPKIRILLHANNKG